VKFKRNFSIGDTFVQLSLVGSSTNGFITMVQASSLDENGYMPAQSVSAYIDLEVCSVDELINQLIDLRGEQEILKMKMQNRKPAGQHFVVPVGRRSFTFEWPADMVNQSKQSAVYPDWPGHKDPASL
jgi:hypothetical protein